MHGQRDAFAPDLEQLADAWREYLNVTRSTGVYTEIEPWAWARLEGRLAELAVTAVAAASLDRNAAPDAHRVAPPRPHP